MKTIFVSPARLAVAHGLRASAVVTVLGLCACRPEAPEQTVASTQGEVVYGNDDRTEYGSFASTDPVRRLADSTALLTEPAGISCSGGTCTIPPEDLNLCPGQKFAGQPAALHMHCTVFLVGPDLFATAGHCIDSTLCSSRKVVFGFRVVNGSVISQVPDSNVYSCTSVVQSSSDPDFALFKVDRPVAGLRPLWVRYSGTIGNTQALTLIGHPDGLPLKIDRGGTVKGINTLPTKFFANTDSFVGNSGSPIFNSQTGVVEGILVAGNSDYSQTQPCLIVHTCSDTSGCPDDDPSFETVTRIMAATPKIPFHPAGIYVAAALL